MDLETATMILDKVVAQHCITAGVEAWQTLKAHCTQPTDAQQLKQAIALVRKQALTFASTSLYNTLDGALVMVEQHACV